MSELIKYDMKDVVTIANSFMQSELFKDNKKSAQVLHAEFIVKIMAGSEMGLTPFRAVQNITIIKGVPSLKPIFLLGLIKQSGKYDYRILEETDKQCRIEYFEYVNGEKESLGVATYTAEEARKMGAMTGKDGFNQYVNQLATMLFHRCAAKGVRRFTPDIVMMNVYIDGEIEEEPRKVEETTFEDVNENIITRVQVDALIKLLGSTGLTKEDMIELSRDVLNQFGFKKIQTITTDKYEAFEAEIKTKLGL